MDFLTLEDVPEVKFTKNLGSGLESGNCQIAQIGKFVMCRISCKTSTAMKSWTSRVIGKLNCTLPFQVSVLTCAYNNRGLLRYEIDSNGNVKLIKDGGATDVAADDITAITVKFLVDSVESN